MNGSTETAESAHCENGTIVVRFRSGLEVRFPAGNNPRLARASLAALNRIEISPFGLHWPELDEDLSFAGLLRGEFGQRKSRAATR